jgi:lantibiotic biosynthesis protein
VRRLLVTTSFYLRRWQRRATPFGLFAGVAAASTGTPATTRLGDEHQVVARADARWMGEIIDGLEQRSDIPEAVRLRRLALRGRREPSG